MLALLVLVIAALPIACGAFWLVTRARVVRR